VKRQLEHLRNEIEGMATQLADEVPSDVEDVDKDFDDESNRWFAREFYAVKHETTLINRMRDDRKQKNGVVKLHRSALRLMQVAASRPILRVLNPHIYSQLGDLVRELVELSTRLGLPLWEPYSILEALEQAVYFPPRKNTNRRQSINPSDVAELLKPKNRKSQSRMKLKDSDRAALSKTSQIQFNLPKKIYSESNRGGGGVVINKKKSILKFSKAVPDQIYQDQNGPRQRPSTAQSRSNARTSKSSGNEQRPRSAQAPQRGADARRCADCAGRPHSPQASSSARLVEIDSFSQPMEEDAPNRRPINTHDARSESAVAPVAPRNPPRGNEFSVIAPGLRKSTENGLPPRTSYIINDSEGQNLKDTESTKRWSAFNAEFERIEREDRAIRIRLSNLYNDAPLSATKTQTTNRQYEEDRREKLELLNLPTKTKSKNFKEIPESFDVTLLQSAVTRPFIQKPSDIQLERSEESLLVNSIADNVLTTLVDDVFIEAEKIMDDYVDKIYQEELNGVDEYCAMSIISSSMLSQSSRSQSTVRNQTLSETQTTTITQTELDVSASHTNTGLHSTQAN